MSDDIRRKKKKAGRRPKHSEAKESPSQSQNVGNVKRETESVTEQRSDLNIKQEKQSFLFKALFFCGILGEILS